HGLAPDENVRRWQRRVEPMQKRFVGGCHFTRPIPDLITAAGFTLSELDTFYGAGWPKADRASRSASRSAPDQSVHNGPIRTVDVAVDGVDDTGRRSLRDETEHAVVVVRQR